jgi:hypothetical protein
MKLKDYIKPSNHSDDTICCLVHHNILVKVNNDIIFKIENIRDIGPPNNFSSQYTVNFYINNFVASKVYVPVHSCVISEMVDILNETK